MVHNLLDNAIRYSPDGGEVRATLADRDGQAELRVADTGLGIPARDLDRIFERFYRVDPARSRGTGGTGLGLAIVRHVAQSHGGDVEVRSVLGAGSTFIVRLPRRRVALDGSRPLSSDPPMPLLLLIRHALTDAHRPLAHGLDAGRPPVRTGPGPGRRPWPSGSCRSRSLPCTRAHWNGAWRPPTQSPRRSACRSRRRTTSARSGTATGPGAPSPSSAGPGCGRRCSRSPSNARFPNGESLLEVQERAATEIGRIAAAPRAGRRGRVLPRRRDPPAARALLGGARGPVPAARDLAGERDRDRARRRRSPDPAGNDTGAVADLIPAKPRRAKMGT